MKCCGTQSSARHPSRTMTTLALLLPLLALGKPHSLSGTQRKVSNYRDTSGMTKNMSDCENLLVSRLT